MGKRLLNEHVQAFQLGEERAFEFFFRQYYAPLCYFAMSLLHHEEDAKDLVQDCFVKLWTRHAMLTKPASIRSFLYTTVKNACIDHIRKKQTERKNREMIISQLDAYEETWLNKVAAAEILREIYNDINDLPPKMQKVFKLFYFEGRSNKEIADLLHTSPETVKKQKSKALGYLKQNRKS